MSMLARLLLLTLMLMAPVLAGAAPAEGFTEIRSIGGITEYRLEANGLQLLLMPVARAPRTSVTVIYRVGSRHERSAAEAGMAHLLEHVSFHGAAGVPDIAVELQRLGVRFNATTSTDRTNYFASFAAGERATLQRVLQLEAARMSGARLDESDIAREKPIVLDELALRGQAVLPQVQQALAATAFRSHSYGRPVIGSVASIEQLSLPVLREFYARHYRPDHAVLMLAGAFEPGEALAAVAQAFGPLASPPAEDEPPEAQEPQQTLPRLTTLRTGSTALAVGWRIPGMAHEQASALALLNLLLPGPAPEDAARSPATLQALPGTGLSRDPGLLGRTLLLPATPSGNAAAREALQGIEQRWLDRLQRQWRPTPELQERFGLLRTDFERQWRLALHDPERAPAMVSEAVGAGDWRLVFRVLEGLPQVRLDDVLAVAGAYLRSENRSVVRGVTDASVTAPQTVEQPLGFLEGLFSRPVQVQRVDDPARVADGDATLGRGEGDAAATGASPVELFETDAAALDAATQRYTLPSGLRMAALSRPNRDERVSLLLQLRWGSPREMARWQAWRPLPALLEEGTTEHSAQQLRQIRQQLQMQLGFVAGPQGLSVQLQARRGTLVQALVLLREMLEKPLLPEAAFRREQAAALSRLGGGGAEERERQYRMIQQGLNRGEPGYVPSAAELAAAWREMRVEDVRAYQQRFVSGNEARVAVVGALPDKLPGVLEELIGQWKQPEAPAYQPFVQHHLPERAQRFVSRAAGDGAQQQAAAALVVMHQEFPLQRDEPDCWPMQAAARILAGNGEPGGTRLTDRLRAAESLSYAVNSSLRIASEGNRSYLRLQASSAPRNAARVETAMREEIDRALADGVTAEEVEAARRWLRANQRQALLNDVGLMALLMEQMDRGADFAAERSQEAAALGALSVDTVNAAMRRLLRPDGWVTVVRGAGGP